MPRQASPQLAPNPPTPEPSSGRARQPGGCERQTCVPKADAKPAQNLQVVKAPAGGASGPPQNPKHDGRNPKEVRNPKQASPEPKPQQSPDTGDDRTMAAPRRNGRRTGADELGADESGQWGGQTNWGQTNQEQGNGRRIGGRRIRNRGMADELVFRLTITAARIIVIISEHRTPSARPGKNR